MTFPNWFFFPLHIQSEKFGLIKTSFQNSGPLENKRAPRRKFEVTTIILSLKCKHYSLPETTALAQLVDCKTERKKKKKGKRELLKFKQEKKKKIKFKQEN